MVKISGDVFVGILQDDAQLAEFRNNLEASFKPLVFPAGAASVLPGDDIHLDLGEPLAEYESPPPKTHAFHSVRATVRMSSSTHRPMRPPSPSGNGLLEATTSGSRS